MPRDGVRHRGGQRRRRHGSRTGHQRRQHAVRAAERGHSLLVAAPLFTETGLSARFTLTGLTIHQASAIFWGVLFEGLLDRWQCHVNRRPRIAEVAAAAATTAAVAYAVDYHAVPSRLTPGFEAHLSKRSMFYVYAALAAGFAAAALCRGTRDE